MEEESKLRRPRKCLGSLIALIRHLGEVIGRVDWLHSSHWADKKMVGCGMERGEATRWKKLM
jgi:hypothetical protein